MKRKWLAAGLTAVCTVMMSFSAFAAEGADEYPLAGILEVVDQTGFEWGSDPQEIKTVRVLRSDGIYSQVNRMSAGDAAVLISLSEPVEFDSIPGKAEFLREVRAEVIRFLNSFDWKNASDYEKAERAARWIAEESVYEIDAFVGNDREIQGTSSEAYPVLIKKKGLCRHFAAAYQLLCRAVGLNCIQYSGTVENPMYHVWNNVQVDGIWRKMDVGGTHEVTLNSYPDALPSATIEDLLVRGTPDDLSIFGEGF